MCVCVTHLVWYSCVMKYENDQWWHIKTFTWFCCLCRAVRDGICRSACGIWVKVAVSWWSPCGPAALDSVSAPCWRRALQTTCWRLLGNRQKRLDSSGGSSLSLSFVPCLTAGHAAAGSNLGNLQNEIWNAFKLNIYQNWKIEFNSVLFVLH